jgi:hypothetical protein
MTLFLAEAAPDHDGPERVADLLNAGAEFLPARDAASGLMTFLHRTAIALVRIPATLESDEETALTLPTEHEVAVSLVGGGEVRGLVSYVRPPERARLVDFLSEPTPFLRVLEPAGTVTLVHKRLVARVVLLAS